MHKSIWVILFHFIFIANSWAQLPTTKAYLFDMKQVNDNTYEFSNPKYLSNFNPDGYNNQPHFMDERTLYMTVQFPRADQSEIFAFDIQKRHKIRITATPDGEYSPQLMPTGDHFSCVREENDGNKTQRLWQFPVDRSNNGKRVLNITDIGYYCWLNATQVALFIVSESEQHQLVIANTTTGEVTPVASNIGRGLQVFPDGNLAYIEKSGTSTWFIKSVNPRTLRSEIVIETPTDSEDFVIGPDGTIYMGNGSKLYKFNKAYDKKWIEIGDFSEVGILKITRLAFNGKRKLVLIDNKG